MLPFKTQRPSERDLLPWWHPWSLMRGGWNIAFSLALGAGIGFMAQELIAQVAARISGEDWRLWSDRLDWLGWLVGCFVAFVSYMSYRMDDRSD